MLSSTLCSDGLSAFFSGYRVLRRARDRPSFRWRWAATGAVFGSLLAGCTGARSADSEMNLRAAVAAALPLRFGCLSVPVSRPQVFPLDPMQAPPHQLTALVPPGIVDRQSIRVVFHGSGWVQAPPQETLTEPGFLFTLSAQAKADACDPHNPSFVNPGVRYGTPQLVEIVRYTVPADTPIGRMTRVTYTYRLTKVAAWARDPAVIETYFLQRDLAAADRPQEQTMTLVLTNRGWQARR